MGASPPPVCHPDRIESAERVAILRALKLGDLLCAVPALRTLRAALPRAEITLIGLPWSRALVDRFDAYLDRFLPFPGYPGLPELSVEPRRVVQFLAEAQDARFDLAIQMHGSGSIVNPLVVLLGARMTAGFYRPGDYCPDPDRFLQYPEQGHEVWRHLRLMERLGLPSRGSHLEFPLRPDDWQVLATIDETRGLQSGQYVCVHPGAGASTRRWPPERFAAVSDALAARGLTVVLTGSSEEIALVGDVVRAMRSPVVNLAGRTGLGPLAALVSRARLLVSNDTGVYHVAVAVGTPAVVVSTEPNADRWGPPNELAYRFICGGLGVTVEAVIDQANALLDLEARQAREEKPSGGDVVQLPEIGATTGRAPGQTPDASG